MEVLSGNSVRKMIGVLGGDGLGGENFWFVLLGMGAGVGGLGLVGVHTEGRQDCLFAFSFLDGLL
jgi:hypothetical protein